jgi:hypothetical protein
MTAEVQYLRSVSETLHLATTEWNGIDTLIEGTRAKIEQKRIKVGRLLNELRDRIDAGEVGELANWWEWFDDFFVRSRKDAQKLMTMAASADPVAEHEKEKAATKQRMRNYRAAQRIEPDGAHSARQNYQDASKTSDIPVALTALDTPDDAPGGLQLNKAREGDPPAKYRLPLAADKPKPKVDTAKVEEMIRIFQSMDWPTRSAFIVRLRQVYRED